MTRQEQIAKAEEQVFRNVLDLLRRKMSHIPRDYPNPGNAEVFATTTERMLANGGIFGDANEMDAETFWECAKRGNRRAWVEHWRTVK